MEREALARELDRYRRQKAKRSRGAAVLIPLIEGEHGLEVLLEVRALTLDVQPGEACLPGGGIEPNETPQKAAVRETCEELLVGKDQLTIIGSMGVEPGPGGRPLYVFVGSLEGYEGSFSASEVEFTFTIPVEWLVRHEPSVFEVTMRPEYPDDFPWDLVPGGRDYAWRPQRDGVPFYMGRDPVVWGATARILMRFAEVWKHSGQKG